MFIHKVSYGIEYLKNELAINLTKETDFHDNSQRLSSEQQMNKIPFKEANHSLTISHSSVVAYSLLDILRNYWNLLE